MVANKGSTARDFLATERNFLTQCRFGLLLSFLSSSFLLRARIPTSEPSSEPSTPDIFRVPLGYVYFGSGICGLCLGLWFYIVSSRRLVARRAFLRVTNLQTVTLAMGAILVLTTCIVLLADEDE